MKSKEETEKFKEYLIVRLESSITTTEREALEHSIRCIEWVLQNGDETTNKTT